MNLKKIIKQKILNEFVVIKVDLDLAMIQPLQLKFKNY